MKARGHVLFFLMICGWICVGPAMAEVLSGQVRLLERGKAIRQVDDVVIYFRPDQPVTPDVPEQPYVMATRGKQFDPQVLPVPVGARVSFPNNDPILHNAFSVSGSNAFDVGLYGKGEGESVLFDTPGLVQVYCNVHQSMVGHLLVLDTPFFSGTDRSGSFRLDGLPEGPGTLYVWHRRASRPQIRSLVLPVEERLELELTLNRRRVPVHLNKHGKSYRKDRRGRY